MVRLPPFAAFYAQCCLDKHESMSDRCWYTVFADGDNPLSVLSKVD
jgi:hypothetical protein